MTMTENASLTLPWLARGRAAASLSNSDDAVRWLNQSGQPRAARLLQKGAVGASATTDSDAATMVGAWTGSMSTNSVFYKIYNDGGSSGNCRSGKGLGLLLLRQLPAS